jgi:uncharacterized RDD family membrane protein YckC
MFKSVTVFSHHSTGSFFYGLQTIGSSLFLIEDSACISILGKGQSHKSSGIPKSRLFQVKVHSPLIPLCNPPKQAIHLLFGKVWVSPTRLFSKKALRVEQHLLVLTPLDFWKFMCARARNHWRSCFLDISFQGFYKNHIENFIHKSRLLQVKVHSPLIPLCNPPKRAIHLLFGKVWVSPTGLFSKKALRVEQHPLVLTPLDFRKFVCAKARNHWTTSFVEEYICRQLAKFKKRWHLKRRSSSH